MEDGGDALAHAHGAEGGHGEAVGTEQAPTAMEDDGGDTDMGREGEASQGPAQGHAGAMYMGAGGGLNLSPTAVEAAAELIGPMGMAHAQAPLVVAPVPPVPVQESLEEGEEPSESQVEAHAHAEVGAQQDHHGAGEPVPGPVAPVARPVDNEL
jgi:hypothetical protein